MRHDEEAWAFKAALKYAIDEINQLPASERETGWNRCMRKLLTALLDDEAVSYAELREAAKQQNVTVDGVLADVFKAYSGVETISFGDGKRVFVWGRTKDRALWMCIGTARKLDQDVWSLSCAPYRCCHHRTCRPPTPLVINACIPPCAAGV